MNGLYLEDVLAIVAKGCQVPNCQHKHDKLAVVARCHPKARVMTIVNAPAGEVQILCEECDQVVVGFKLAPFPRGKKNEWDEDPK